MRYGFKCTKCLKEEEVELKLDEYSEKSELIKCSECNSHMVRIYFPAVIFGETSVKEQN